MKKVATVFMAAVIVALLLGRAIAEEKPTVIIVGATRMTAEDFQPLQKEFPESVVLIARGYYPPGVGAEDILQQIQERELKGPFVFISHSFGGLYARTAATKIPDVKAIVTIATPLGKFRFTPECVSDLLFRPDDDDSEIPLFVIASYMKDPPAERPWWVRDDSQTDGLVAVESVMSMGLRKTEGRAVFEGEHCELLAKPEFISQVKIWLEPYLDK